MATWVFALKALSGLATFNLGRREGLERAMDNISGQTTYPVLNRQCWNTPNGIVDGLAPLLGQVGYPRETGAEEVFGPHGKLSNAPGEVY